MKSQKNENEQKENQSVVLDYFNLTKKYENIYGERTILLYQVGSFMEIYGFKDETDNINGSQITDVCGFCQLNIADKKTCVDGKNIVMAGFRDYVLDKYLQKITDNNYTAVVYVQEKNGKNVIRKFQGIYSPGTYLNHETENTAKITNNIMCVWFEKSKSMKNSKRDELIYGVSIANIFTGQTFIFEHQIQYYLNPTTFDELERCVSVYSPCEVIFISPFDAKTIDKIIKFSGISCEIIHKLDTTNVENFKIQNCMKQKYLFHILSLFFGEDCFHTCKEFSEYSIATQSFCYLLDFIQEHNPNLVRKISLPIFNNYSNRMTLANHTLKQLNIINEKDNNYGVFSSVLSFLNKCLTSMGKRMFQHQLTNPTFDEKWLNEEYKMISAFIDNYNEFNEFFRKKLSGIRDLDKLSRQLVSRKICPSSIFYLYNAVASLKEMSLVLSDHTDITDYLLQNIENSQILKIKKDNNMTSFHIIDNICEELIVFIDENFELDICKNIQSLTVFDENFIKPNVSKKLDELIAKRNASILIFEEIKNYFNHILKTTEKNEDTEYVKKHETEKSGISLQLTKKRATLLKKNLKEKDEKTEIRIGEYSFKIEDIKIISVSANNDEINFPLLNKAIKDIYLLKDEINSAIIEVYGELLKNIENDWYEKIEFLSKCLTKIDVLQSKAYISKINNYCCPIITSTPSKSFVKVKNMRHVLIEHLQQNEIYITNDLIIGYENQNEANKPKDGGDKDEEMNGVLLYGTNAVGKTSFIRSLGISLIMAQSGMFVPCSYFLYKPYTAIFSRILGNDNLFKGLSTFAVEMSELRIILKMADENSLILGDEVCSGTETESALSIFVSALEVLHEKKSSFIFATHFHEIVHYEEIKKMDKLQLCHMSVSYDRENDCLIYDRKLKNGPGNRMYGLEVCKSLYLPDEFLNRSYEIRNKYFPENKGELSQKTTVYNSVKIRGMCELCKEEIAEETHHILHQKDADKNGYIGSVHKNHFANLLAVCQKCHHKMHTNEKEEEIEKNILFPEKKMKISKKKTTKGMKLMVFEENED